MRTTVTLDPDVAEQLKSVARRKNQPFKVVLNDAVRAGLAAERGAKKPYKLPTFSLGLRPGVDLTHASQLVGELEDEETIRKLEMRK